MKSVVVSSCKRPPLARPIGWWQVCALLGLVLSAGIALSQAQTPPAPEVLYAQGFANDSGANKSAGDYGWRWHRNGYTAEQSSNVISTYSGSDPLVNVAAPTPAGDESVKGQWTFATSNYRAFGYTEIAISRAAYPGVTLAMDLNNNDDAAEFRFVVRLGSTWYASAQVFTQGNSWAQKDLVLAPDSLWMPLVKDGSALDIVTTETAFNALAGDITAVGFYREEQPATAASRVDNFVVTATAFGDGGTVVPVVSIVQVVSGGTVRLSALPMADGIFTYQWRKDGAILEGAVAETLLLSEVSAADSGRYTVTMAEDQAEVTPFPLELSVVDAVDLEGTFSSWILEKQVAADQRGPTDDPDGDGLANLLEFALGLDPMVSDQAGLLVTAIAVDGIEYPAVTYTRNLRVLHLSVDVKVSFTLKFAGSDSALEISTSENGDGTETVIVRSTTPFSEAASQFFRLEVDQD